VIAYVYKPTGRRIYRARVRLDGDSSKVMEKSLGTADKRVAEKRLAEWVTQLEHERAGIALPPGLAEAASKKLVDHLDDWDADRAAVGKTAEYRRHVTARFASVAAVCNWEYVKDIKPDAFVRWRADRSDLSAKSLNHHLDAVRTIVAWMERRGRAASNPIKHVEKLPAGIERQTFKRAALRPEEKDRLCSGRNGLVYFMALTTGLRHGELRQLNV